MGYFSTLYHHPLESVSFFSVIMAICSLWIKKNPMIWGAFTVIALITSLASSIISPLALVPIVFFALLIFALRLDIQGLSLFLLSSTAFLIGGGLFFTVFPGFSSVSYGGFFCNYGLAYASIFLLAWNIPILSFGGDHFKTWLLCIGLSFLGAALLLAYQHTSFRIFDSFLSFSFLAHIGSFLFFTVIPEETLLRGFLQRQIVIWLKGGIKAEILAVIITAFLYPLFHLSWVAQFSLLVPIFISGLIYSTIYQLSKKIECAIITHFLAGVLYLLLYSSYLYLD